MSEKFTPGPWHAQESHLGSWYVDEPIADEGAIAEVFNSAADARLIAAAPELYGLLDEMLDSEEWNDGEYWAWRQRARAVFAKARGEA